MFISTSLSILNVLFHLVLTKTLRGRYSDYFYFSDDKNEAKDVTYILCPEHIV